jgi:hypothetical protein
MGIRKHPTDAKTNAASLEHWRKYLAAARSCDSCGAALDDNYRVITIACEMREDIVTLLDGHSICDLCVADLPQFELRNPLAKIGFNEPLPIPQERREIERSEQLQEDAQAARQLQQRGVQLEKQVATARGPAARRRIEEEINQLVTATLGSDQGEPGLGAVKRDTYSDRDEHKPAPPDRNDLRIAVQRFLASPYFWSLPRGLRCTAHLFAGGLGESEIAQQLKIGQPTVSRQVQRILHAARRRR